MTSSFLETELDGYAVSPRKQQVMLEKLGDLPAHSNFILCKHREEMLRGDQIPA